MDTIQVCLDCELTHNAMLFTSRVSAKFICELFLINITRSEEPIRPTLVQLFTLFL